MTTKNFHKQHYGIWAWRHWKSTWYFWYLFLNINLIFYSTNLVVIMWQPMAKSCQGQPTRSQKKTFHYVLVKFASATTNLAWCKSKLLYEGVNNPSYKICNLQRTFPKCSWSLKRGTHRGTEWHSPCGRSCGTRLLSASSPRAACGRSTSGAERPTRARRRSALPRRRRLRAKRQNRQEGTFQHS